MTINEGVKRAYENAKAIGTLKEALDHVKTIEEHLENPTGVKEAEA